MGRRGPSIILIPFLAAAAAIHPLTLYRREPALALASQSPKAFSREPEPGKGSGEKTEEARRYTAKRIISQFLGTLPDGEWPDGDPRSKYRIHFLIATVPDPIESRLPIFFDRFLGSIQRAAERAGYVLDRFDLPWRPPALRIEGSKETIGAQSERQRRNAQEKDSNPDERPIYQTNPGLLLFRKSQSSDLLLVFLVGETPTAGVHKTALSEALDQVAWSCRWPHHGREALPSSFPTPSCSGINLLGPSFSGSADSLDFTLNDWLNLMGDRQKPKITIISGSATAIDPKVFPRIVSRGRASFKATVIPDEAALSSFRLYLARLTGNAHRAKVAWLTEGNTAYGASARDFITNEQPQAPKALKITPLTFPLHLSQLRSQAEKARRAQSESSPQFTTKPSLLLPLPLDETGEQKETIPSFPRGRWLQRKQYLPISCPLSPGKAMSTSVSWRPISGIRSFWQAKFENTAPEQFSSLFRTIYCMRIRRPA